MECNRFHRTYFLLLPKFRWPSPEVPLQAELLALTIQLRTSQPSIPAVMRILIQVGPILHILQMISTAARLVMAHLDFCTSWGQTHWFLLFFKIINNIIVLQFRLIFAHIWLPRQLPLSIFEFADSENPVIHAKNVSISCTVLKHVQFCLFA